MQREKQKMRSVSLLVLLSGILFVAVSANEELGNAIRACRDKYPGSDERTIEVTDYQSLPRDDKCYLHCALSAQKLIVNGVLNTDSPAIQNRCGAICDADECEFGAKLQQCVLTVVRSTPIP